MAAHLRKVAAAARELLVDRAAAGWGVERGALRVDGGAVADPATGRALGFGALAGGGALEEEYGDDAPITPPARWTVAGRSAPAVDGRAIVTGRRRYTPDLARPGLLVGMVLRAPRSGARLAALDMAAAAALPGVAIVRVDDFVGVVAPDRQAAGAALGAIRAEWAGGERHDARDLFASLRAQPAPAGGGGRPGRPQRHEVGSVEEGRAAAARTLARTYNVAYIAHAPLEPRAAVAEWHDGRLTVWTGTQRPFGVRDELARAFGLPEADVRVVVPETGGAYGGKHTGEAAIEAARLARAVGRPVKLVWTREEEFTQAYFRPAGSIDIASGVGADGGLVAWECHNYNSGASGLRTPYDVPHQRSEFHPAPAPLRQGSYRALAATANHFAREVHMDELAGALGLDPLAFRLRNLQDDRLRAVLEAAAARFGWGRAPAAPGHGSGIAGGTEKGSYVATCAEVAVDRAGGQVRVVRVVQAFECGAIVNPDGVRNQVVGAIIQGIGGALFEAVDFADGIILTDRFSRYRVPRFADVPPIDIVLLDRPDLPSAGAGETPIVGIAPAIGNAIHAATGRRLRSLPLAPHGLPPGGDDAPAE